MQSDNKTLYGIKDDAERFILVLWNVTVLVASLSGDSIILIGTIKYNAIKHYKMVVAIIQHLAVSDIMLYSEESRHPTRRNTEVERNNHSAAQAVVAFFISFLPRGVMYVTSNRGVHYSTTTYRVIHSLTNVNIITAPPHIE
jgi:hypothetical protein